MTILSPSNTSRGGRDQNGGPKPLSEGIREWLDSLPEEAREGIKAGMAEA